MLKESRIVFGQSVAQVKKRRIKLLNPVGIRACEPSGNETELLDHCFEGETALFEICFRIFVGRETRGVGRHDVVALDLQFVQLIMQILILSHVFYLFAGGLEDGTECRGGFADLRRINREALHCRDAGSDRLPGHWPGHDVPFDVVPLL